MITLPIKTIDNQSFSMALSKLANNPHFPATTAYNIAKILDKVEEEVSHKRDDYFSKVKKWSSLDEHGNVKFSAPGQPMFLDSKAESEFKVYMEEMMKGTIKIPRHKIALQVFEEAQAKLSKEDMKLTPKELYILKDIFHELEAV